MKIGLVPMAAKPYHSGHHALVEKAARENDQVKLFISTTDRSRPNEITIKGSDMLRVWKDHIEPILPGNVIPVYVRVPVREVYEDLRAAESQQDPNNSYMVYSDPEDTAANYPENYRQKYFPELYSSGRAQFAAECDGPGCTRGVGMPDISGTTMREYLEAGNFSEFAANMPPGIDAQAVYDILRGVREYVKAVWFGGLR